MSLKYKPGQSDRAAPADPGGAGELSIDALLPSLPLSLSHTHCLSCPLSLSLSHTLSRSLAPSLSLSLSRALSLSRRSLSSVDGATRGGMQVQVTS